MQHQDLDINTILAVHQESRSRPFLVPKNFPQLLPAVIHICIHFCPRTEFVGEGGFGEVMVSSRISVFKKLTNHRGLLLLWQKACTQHPGEPHDHCHQHQHRDVAGLVVVVLDVHRLDSEAADEDQEEDDVGEGGDVVGGGVVAGGHQHHPLDPHHQLDQDTEGEEEGLVHGWQVDPCVEGDEEDLLHQQGGVDEDVGEAGAEPDGHAGGGRLLQGVDQAQGGAQEQTKEESL